MEIAGKQHLAPFSPMYTKSTMIKSTNETCFSLDQSCLGHSGVINRGYADGK